MVDSEFLKEENQNMVLVSDTMEDLLDKMKRYEAPAVPKWMKLDET